MIAARTSAPSPLLRLLAALALCAAGCGDAPTSGAAAGPAPDAATRAAPGAAPGTDTDPPSAASRGGPHVIPADDHAWDWPSLACRTNGDTWLGSVYWKDGADHLALRLQNQAETSQVVVYTSPTRVLGTALAADASGALHLVWSERQDDGWALRTLVFAAPERPGEPGAPGEPTTLLAVPGAHLLWPSLAEDERHALLLTCISLDGQGPAVLALARSAGGAWSAPAEVSTQRDSNWSPSATSTGEGRFAIVWDSAAGGDYDVLLADCVLSPEGVPVITGRHRVTDTPRRESHPSAAFDGTRLYIAYDVAAERWGHEGSVNKLGEALHAGRRIEIVAVQDGTVAPLAVQPLEGGSEVLANNSELPRLAFESTGSLVLLFRVLPLPLEVDDPEDPAFLERADSKGGGVGWRTSTWWEYMTRFDGASWHIGDRHHVGIAGSEGRADAGCALTRLPGGGTAYAAVGDGRSIRQEAPEATTADGGATGSRKEAPRIAESLNWWRPVSRTATSIATGMLRKEARVAEFALLAGTPLSEPRAATSPAAAMPRRTGPDGRSLQLALGDLHRHTDLSRCSSNWDGPFEDALRYAFDVAPLQFLAITDHFEHMTAYDWWRSTSWADAYDAPGRLTSLRAYERSDIRSGHRNIIARGDGPPLVGYSPFFNRDRDSARADTAAEFWALLDDKQVLTIPHTPAGMYPGNPTMLDWSSFQPQFDRLVEIFQSYRGSSEAVDAPRAIPGLVPRRYVLPNLDFGMHFGFIASSDHQTSDGAFAGAWVTELTREGVFDALHARLTFASTVRASLWTEWNGVPMGVSAAAPPGVNTGFVVDVDGFGRELATLELITDGAVTQRRDVHGSSAHERFALSVPATGSRYACVRVTFADGELMWSSPVRLSRQGSQGADGISGAQVLQQRGDVWNLPTPVSPGNPGTPPPTTPAGPR